MNLNQRVVGKKKYRGAGVSRRLKKAIRKTVGEKVEKKINTGEYSYSVGPPSAPNKISWVALPDAFEGAQATGTLPAVIGIQSGTTKS